MKPRPIAATQPAWKPYSAGFPFIDGKGPPPYEFFNEAQDHIGALAHAGTGWRWSADREDFVNEVYPVGYLGKFAVNNLPVGAGLSLTPLSPVSFQGEHGVWRGLSGGGPYDFEMWTGASNIGRADFLVSAKVLCLNRSAVQPVADNGFWVGCGRRTDAMPAICGGADQVNWQVWCPPEEGAPPQFFDTGIPFHDSQGTMPDTVQRAGHVLQISRVGGALRFFINGRIVRLRLGNVDREGIYYPAELPLLRRYFRTRRWAPGPANQGFYIDFFHRLARR